MARLCINDNQWQRIQRLIPDVKPGGRPILDRRNILDGILWILPTGAPWRDLPKEFGKWQTVWRLFDQWNGDGTLDTILQNLQGEIIINTELWCIDGTVIRAARCAAGGGKRGTRKSLWTMHWGGHGEDILRNYTFFVTAKEIRSVIISHQVKPTSLQSLILSLKTLTKIYQAATVIARCHGLLAWPGIKGTVQTG